MCRSPQVESAVHVVGVVVPVEVPGEALELLPPAAPQPGGGLLLVKDHLVEELLGDVITHSGQSSTARFSLQLH